MFAMGFPKCATDLQNLGAPLKVSVDVFACSGKVRGLKNMADPFANGKLT